jgi:hypothetical protein
VALTQSDVNELLDAIRAGGDIDVIRKGVELVLQALIEAEATEHIGADRYERTETRTTQRNGHRDRLLATKAGDVELKIPKLRHGSFFPRSWSAAGASTGRCSQRTTAIREDRIVSVLDEWLGQLTDAGHRETTIAAVLAADTAHASEPPNVQAARRALRDLPVELDRVLAAIRAGMDPNLAVITTKQIQRDLAAAELTISAWEHQHDAPTPLTADQIREALDHAGSLAAMLSEAERETRARLYQALDLELLLDPVGESPTVDVWLQLCGGGGSVESHCIGKACRAS